MMKAFEAGEKGVWGREKLSSESFSFPPPISLNHERVRRVRGGGNVPFNKKTDNLQRGGKLLAEGVLRLGTEPPENPVHGVLAAMRGTAYAEAKAVEIRRAETLRDRLQTVVPGIAPVSYTHLTLPTT